MVAPGWRILGKNWAKSCNILCWVGTNGTNRTSAKAPSGSSLVVIARRASINGYARHCLAFLLFAGYYRCQLDRYSACIGILNGKLLTKPVLQKTLICKLSKAKLLRALEPGAVCENQLHLCCNILAVGVLRRRSCVVAGTPNQQSLFPRFPHGPLEHVGKHSVGCIRVPSIFWIPLRQCALFIYDADKGAGRDQRS